MVLRAVVAIGLAAGLLLGTTTASHAGAAAVVLVTPPAVTGDPAYGSALTADPGTWEPGDATYAYQWLRDGQPIDGADRRTFRPRLRDLQHEVYVRVTASSPGYADGEATSGPVTVRKGVLVLEHPPTTDGAPRFGHTLVARAATWDRRPDAVRYQWLRDGKAVPGARGPRRLLGLADFGTRMSVRATVVKEGYRQAVATSAETRRIGQRVPVRHVVRYHVETRGDVSADVAVFKRLAQQTYDDPRGWRGSGVKLERVASGGAFTLVLAEASELPRFSSGCSADWSCRVGRFVVINQTRWLHASPMWHRVHRSLRDYRHMVVNHETGHWLGWDHRSCPRNGAPAPVMQQQSKGLDGCRANPWPTSPERAVPRFR